MVECRFAHYKPSLVIRVLKKNKNAQAITRYRIALYRLLTVRGGG